MALSLQQRIAMLEAIAVDEKVKATQRLRAMEELGRIESRQMAAAGAGSQEPDPSEMAPDPMADLDEMEAQRQKRAARGKAGDDGAGAVRGGGRRVRGRRDG
jgi:hypothetical protein